MWARMVGKLGAAAFWAYWQRRRGQGVEDVSRSPHPRVVARADPHPSTTHSPPNIRFYPLRTKRARACMRTCVRACVRVLGRTRACRASCLRGACTGRMCARTARVVLRLCELCVCAHAWNRYMPCSFLFFSFTGAPSLSFFLSLSPYRSLSVYACLSFSVLKNRRIRGT